MRKHRLRNRVKSIVGSLIDPDKDEELKDTNIETEDNYEKILELLKNENPDDMNKLTGLIEEFHTRYQSIYQRYDNITGKLKEKVRSKKEKEDSSSSSSSSDSDSDSNKNGNLDMVEDSLKVEIEAANREIEELNRKLKAETEEKEALNLQYQSALNKVQETENMFNDSKLQSHRFHEENSKLLAETTHLNSKIEAINIEKMETIEELRAIKEEKSNAIEKLEATEAENKSLSQKVSELSEEIKRLEMKIEETTEEIENGVRSKEQIVDELEEAIEDLKNDLEIKGDEVNTLTETVRNLEVKIRLSNQKLRITEQLLHETEHDHSTKEQKLHQQNKTLIEKMSTLSETISFMKKEVQEKVNETSKGFDLLTVKFEEDFGHVMTRVCEIRNEVKAVEIQARVNRSNNEYLKGKVEERVMELSGSLENAKGRILEKDEKIKELEGVICVKDEEMLCVCEDKREAIRQLCVWGDYQRDRCDGLLEVLKPVVDNSRR
ncbi:COP1-interactive protein 1 [Lactuca sativa]|uniref:NAB domain-containing protein n=1 Tax=Lactuca sativa TaxID=4236 RepID=A0A9R1X6A9_LACSA|nr:COP1-interactive protein 1 [Lactuca sativa]XP_023742709.1 COP1-interactive protein 1 [Lactuca sativa]KAJ0200289.1 hypothetical protein LSAT_V11C600330590 [Lactuca sativa]